VEVAQLHGVEDICHEKNRIRTMSARFEDLVFVDEEILSQNGLGESGADFRQTLDAHAEVGAIGQNRHRTHMVRGGVSRSSGVHIFLAHRADAW